MRPKFSTFLRSVVVEMDNREAPTFPEGNIVEVRYPTDGSLSANVFKWHPQSLAAPLDGFEVSRRGDVDVNCRIITHVAHSPERFRVQPLLADLIAMREGTRADVMGAVWKFVKVAGAQDKEDGTVIRPVGGFEKVSTPAHELQLTSRYFPEMVYLSTNCLNWFLAFWLIPIP